MQLNASSYACLVIRSYLLHFCPVKFIIYIVLLDAEDERGRGRRDFGKKDKSKKDKKDKGYVMFEEEDSEEEPMLQDDTRWVLLIWSKLDILVTILCFWFKYDFGQKYYAP